MIKDQALMLRKAMEEGAAIASVEEKSMKIITITSGKGGVGKSNLTANIATTLAHRGRNPIILDADLGLANIEIVLGAQPKKTLANLIKEECKLDEIINKASNGVSFISGGSGIQEMAFLNNEKLESIGNQLDVLKEHTDLLLIDTGAGINESVLRFTMIADEIIVVVVPEPASIADSYSLIKTMLSNFKEVPHLKIVVNKATSDEEGLEVFNRIEFACRNFLNIEVSYLGAIPYDENVSISAKQQLTITDYNAKSKASIAYHNMASSLVESKNKIETPRKWKDRLMGIFSKK